MCQEQFCVYEDSEPVLNWSITPQGDENIKIYPDSDSHSPSKKGQSITSPATTIFVPFRIEQKKASDQKEKEKHTKAHIWFSKFMCEAKITDFLVAIFTYFLFVVTYELARITKKLWEAGEKQTALINKSSISQAIQTRAAIREAKRSADAAMAAIGSDRAWICFDKLGQGQFTNGNIDGVAESEGILFWCEWKNKGRTPAIQNEAHIGFKIIPFSDNTPPSFEEELEEIPSNTVPIGPDCLISSAKQAIGEAQRNAFVSRQTAIIVYSAVRYRDIFNSNVIRTSKCCLKITYGGEISVGDGKFTAKWDMRPFGSQNTAT